MLFLSFLVLILIAVAIALFARSEKLTARVAQIERRLELLEAGPRATAQPVRPSVTTPAAISSPPAQPSPAALPPVPPPPPLPAVPPSRTREEWEALVGGKLLNRIGAVALIIGVGLFLKYAIDQEWITETFRAILGGVVGFGLLLTADRARRKEFTVFAQGLVGAGIAILYLSVYASFNYYSLVSQPVAFILMSLVTVVAFLHAFRFDSLAVALIGWAGGFLTPLMLSTGVSSEVGLFSYVLLLDAGIVAVARARERWTALEPLALSGSWALYYLWWFSEYSSEAFGVTLLFLLLFWGLFHGLDILLSRKDDSLFRRLNTWGNSFLATIALWLLMSQSDPDRTGLAFLLFALGYAGSAALLFSRRGTGLSAPLHYSLLSTLLVACAIFEEASGFVVPILLEGEALLLMFLGSRLGEKPIRTAGEVFIGVGAVALLATEGAFGYVPLSAFVPFWNDRAMAFLSCAAACASASALHRGGGGSRVAEGASYGWIISLLLLITVEISDIFLARALGATEIDAAAIQFNRFLSLALAWCGAGFMLLASTRGNWHRELATAGIWTLLLGASIGTLCGVGFTPIETFVPVMNFRSVALVLFTCALLFSIPILRDLRERSSWFGEFTFVVRIIAALVLLALLTGEIRDLFGRMLAELGVRVEEDASERMRLENLKQLSLSGGWLLYSIALMAWGLARRLRSLRVMAIVLFGVTTVKIVLFDLSFLETSYRFVSFIALGVILLAASYLYRRYKEIITEPSAD